MMEKPLISVIMGVYNANEQQLDLAISSILMQTYTNLEFIICDDASNNGTSQWLQKYADRDSRIRILRNDQNKKLATTLNRCIAAARGEFIARQDDDDISDPTRLERQYQFLMEHEEIDFVGSNCCLYNKHKGVFGQRYMPEFPQKKDFAFNSPFIHGSLMFRSSCLNINCCYRTCRWTDRTEDYDLFMHMYSLDKRGANIQENLYCYHYGSQQQHIAMRYRMDEMVLRYQGFRKLGMLPRYSFYVVKPVFLGLMPDDMVTRLRDFRNQFAFAV